MNKVINTSIALLMALMLSVCGKNVIASSTVSVNQDEYQQEMNAFIKKLQRDFDFPSGISIAVVKGEHIFYQQHFGYADIKNKQPVTDNTAFYIASVTKPIFAITMLQKLAQKGMGLETTLAQLFPNTVFAADIRANEVTVRHLLNHTSGLKDDYLQTAVAFSGVHNSESRLAMVGQLKINEKAPLGQFEYSNLGYNILSVAYENLFKQAWQDAVADIVFQPLSMSHSNARISAISKQGGVLAKPYSFFTEHYQQPGYLIKQDNTMHAAGGVVSTAEDMAKFVIAQLNQGQLEGKQVIGKDFIAETQQPSADVDGARGNFERKSYGLGWYIGNYKGHELYHHFGSFSGFRPHLSFIPKQRVGLVILNNEDMLNDKLTDIIADFSYSLLFGDKKAKERIYQRAEDLKAQALVFRERIAKKEQDYRDMTWDLELAKSAYVGIYTHPFAGRISVNLVGNKGIQMKWGNLQSMATASPHSNTMRVKFVPTSPQFVKFTIVNNQVTELITDGIVFSRDRL